MKSIVIDLDNTLTIEGPEDYQRKRPNKEVVALCNEYKNQGFKVIISTSRNMRTYDGNIGMINANTLPLIIKWLDDNNVLYDEIYVGKPWCGPGGFYVDDKAIRPDEFVNLKYNEIMSLVGEE